MPFRPIHKQPVFKVKTKNKKYPFMRITISIIKSLVSLFINLKLYKMKKKLFKQLFILLVILNFKSYAQFNYDVYGVDNVSGTYNDLGSLGTVINTSNFDDDNSVPENIGFTFSFNNQSFTQFILNTNGFIKLGSTPPSSVVLCNRLSYLLDSSAFASPDTNDVNIIAVLNHDLEGGTGAEYRVNTSGITGSRVCTIQYKNVKDRTNDVGSQYNIMNFQIKLYETSNIVELVYGSWVISSNPSSYRDATGGLKGSSPYGSDVVRAQKSSFASWNQTTFFDGSTGYNVATVQGYNFGNTVGAARPAPDPGRIFRFNPKKPNDAAVSSLYYYELAPKDFYNPQTISGVIVNRGTNVLQNLNVILTVSGANPFTSNKIIGNLNPGEKQLVEFENFTPVNLGDHIINIAVPNDDKNDNNSQSGTLKVTKDIFSTTQSTTNSSSVRSPGGMLLCKYKMNFPVKIDTVKVYIAAGGGGSNCINHTVYAVVLDSAGNEVGRSANFQINAADLATFKSFPIVNSQSLDEEVFYAGLAHVTTTGTCYPVGTVPLADTTYLRMFYYAPINSSNLILSPGSVNYMIQAVASSNSTGITSKEMLKHFDIFPNPAHEKLFIRGYDNIKENLEITIYDFAGKQIKNINVNELLEQSVNIKDLQPGIYFIELSNKEAKSLHKFIKE